MELKFCGQCGRKLIILNQKPIGKVLFCKKCHLFFPYSARWIPLDSKITAKTGENKNEK